LRDVIERPLIGGLQRRAMEMGVEGRLNTVCVFTIEKAALRLDAIVPASKIVAIATNLMGRLLNLPKAYGGP